MENTTNYNEYDTTTKIEVVSIPTKNSESFFLEHKGFWELTKKNFEEDFTISIRIYKNIKKLSIEVSDFDEFYVQDITKILKNKKNASKSQVENAENIYNFLWKELKNLEKIFIVDMSKFSYGDFFVKYN